MGRKLYLVMLFAAMLIVLACDTSSFIALNNPTATATRTPRPTFTPRPSPTPEQSPTPEPTLTVVPSPVPSPTQRVVATARPATPKPPAPTPIPAPTFPVTLSDAYFCEQPQSPVWKITARVNRGNTSYFLGGYILGVFTADGKFLKASEPSAYDGNQTITIGGNCRVAKWYQSNLEIDVTEFRAQLPLIVRIIKSKDDHTPLSKDFRADFAVPGHYYIQYNTQ